MEIKSQINAPPADYGSEKGPAREGSPSINLNLGIGAGECIGIGPSPVTKQGKSGFTPAQLHELHQQELILKYIVSGLPVPFHLIFPIWKAVARCFGSANGGIYNLYPSFIGFGHQGFDYRDTMDPEPGRCRRTDGKKWRCSKDVIPDQKYCERHMHRGRQRSRKHVEDSAVNSESGRTLNFDSTTSITNSRDISSTKTHVSVLVPVKLQLATPSSNTSSHTFAASAPTTTCTNRNANDAVAKKDFTVATTLPIYNSNNESNKNIYDSKDTPATITTFGFTSAASDNSRVDHGSIDGKHARYNHLHQRINIEGSSNIKNSCKAGTLVASRIGFSPKSVLQVVGCSSSLVDYRNVVETEFQRCRRTDGKKWQCSKDVIPDQKYCGRHLHRGTKKLSTMSELVTVAAPPPRSSTVCHGPPLAIPKKADEHNNLDTSLSISIAASPRQMTSDEGISATTSSSSSSSSSDATTITDENGRVSQYFLDLSP